MTEEINEQGAVDMGVAPEFLPGQARFDDAGARERFAKAWGRDCLPPGSGANLMEILERCRSGQIKALYVIGENPLATLPASMDVRGALDKLELLICQDPFMTETAQVGAHRASCLHLCGEGRHLHQPGRKGPARSSGDGSDGRKLSGLAHHDRPSRPGWDIRSNMRSRRTSRTKS